jgi:hypothetical protein
MEFKKERNFIVAYDGVIKLGAWDISNGSFIGKSGKPVKTVPSCFTYRNLPSWRRGTNDLAYAIYWYRTNLSDNYTNVMGAHFEQLLSLGLFPNSTNSLCDKLNLNKKIVEYLKEENQGYYDSIKVARYLALIQYEQYINTLPDWAKDVFSNLLGSDIPTDYIKTALNRVIHEHVDAFVKDTYYISGKIYEMLKDYYNISMTLFNKVEVEKNFLTKYAILKYLAEEYKNQHYNDELVKNNDKPWLYYENETFIVKPILTKEDFHIEGEAQRNCVERMYMEKVYKGQTHVVTIRRKSDPDKSYITCEVNNDGRIWQYLARCNETPKEQDARNFKAEYSQHLKKNYKEN